MCRKKEWFSIYKPYDGGSDLMGNDVVCKTIDIENIRMRMFDRHVRTLTNVRHVQDLKKTSCLELWKLKDKSFQVQMEESRAL